MLPELSDASDTAIAQLVDDLELAVPDSVLLTDKLQLIAGFHVAPAV